MSKFLRLAGVVACCVWLIFSWRSPIYGQTTNGVVPLIGYWPMDKGNELLDAGPNKLNGTAHGISFVPGKVGQATQFNGGDFSASVGNNDLINGAGGALSVTFCIKADAYPTNGGGAGLVAKRDQNVAAPFIISLGHNGELGFEGNNGADWSSNFFTGPGVVPLKEWVHIAFTFKANDKVTFYVNGKDVGSKAVGRALAANDQSLNFGRDAMRGAFNGAMDEVRLYAATLTPAQVQMDMSGKLPTRAATKADFPPPTHLVSLALVRYDMPYALVDNYGRTHATAERKAGPDAVDWPSITWKNQTLFTQSATQQLDILLRDGDAARPLFQQPGDEVLQPGNHWFRPVQWLWGQRYVYTTDRTARSWGSDYELWTFPVKIMGSGASDIQNVSLKVAGIAVYSHGGPLHSLTLLLPQNEIDKPYELTINGRSPVTFNAGLQPVQPGNPHNIPIPINLQVPGAGPQITIANLEHPEVFAYQKEWDADLQDLAKFKAPSPNNTTNTASMASYLGLEVPRSPITINSVGLPHGMHSGSYYASDFRDVVLPFSEIGTPEDYANYLADTGYDRTFERTGYFALDKPDDPKSPDALAAALARHGIQFGLVSGVEWGRPFLAHPNLAFFSYNLPDYHAPLYRDLQLAMQHLNHYGNLAGVSIGADNGAYVSFWDWAPPIPNRPWGEPFVNFQSEGKAKSNLPLSWPELRSFGGQASVKDFLAYVARYNETFKQYGYFAQAVNEVDPKLVATTGSFGSSPGVGAGGGWPWATVPGKEMFERMQVQQAYDWNEQASSKPMHNEALVDRLRSYNPTKPTWALIDDFKLFMGREARQRAYALALTRGVQGIGTTFLPNPRGERARPEIIADQKELYSWIHKYGGAYAMTQPLPSIGILYVNEQALLRRADQGGNSKPEGLPRGDHEGKVTEALFLCHAAGWPAKVITPEELKRGLPASMQAIVLVGLNQFDNTWSWFEGLTPRLQQFTQAGGRILLDDESVCPVAATQTGMTVRSYVTNRDMDWTPELLKRNADNITKLRAAMQGVPPPFATSSDPTIWAIPTFAGDTQYVTVVNQGYEDGKNANKYVKSQTGKLIWNTNRPIYDVRLGHKITPQEAATVDLTKDAFQYYALPPAEVTAPKVLVRTESDGFIHATVTIGDGNGMSGIPVQLTVTKGAESATIYGASSNSIKLPLQNTLKDEPFSVEAKELLSGLAIKTSGLSPAKPYVPMFSNISGLDLEIKYGHYMPFYSASVASFNARKQIPLTIALTPEQANDPSIQKLAQQLEEFYTKAGRTTKIGRIEPNDVVLSLQPFKSIQTHPRWKTIDSDLVLLGNPSNNMLLLDQARGDLLPSQAGILAAGQASVSVTYSPFVGECQVLNIIANDVAGLTKGVQQASSSNQTIQYFRVGKNVGF